MADNHGQSNDPNTGKLTGNQIIQQARGNLIKRNDSRVLARGELFIQTVNLLQENVVATREEVAPAGVDSSKRKYRIYDLGTKSYINTFFEGDLFAGSGRYGEVWSLGSGGALKWGGVIGFDSTVSDPWEALKEKGKTKPNFIFMYVGTRPISKSTSPDGLKASDKSIETLTDTTIKNREPGTRGEEPVDVESRYVGHSSTEAAEIINPGDLFFYSPVYDENVVIHLSHSTDALTKINQFALVSNSMKAYFKEKLGELGEDGTRFATLKDFLDGPARRFQSMIGNEGWNAVTITAVEENEPEDEASHIIGCTNITPEDFAEDFDGAIHYIPFTNGRHRVPFVAGETTDQQWIGEKRLHEGDLILTIPAEGGGVKYSVISLYGGLLDMLSAKNLNFHRADAYADSVWNQKNATKDYDETDEEFKANLENTITDYILRLFETKVDIDPYTKKIISSQLPDFLLGAPKYMGAINEVNPLDSIITAIKDGEDPEELNAHDVAKSWSEKFANIDRNDDNETSDKDSNESEGANPDDDNYDTRLQAGCYWIWNAGHFVIDELGDYFNLQSKDDFDEDSVDPETGDNLSGDKKVGEFVHALENGDWIVYNGANKKFDILDNSSTFVGIIMDGVKLSGTPEFKDYQRDINEKNWDGEAVAAIGTKAPHEVKLDPQDTHNLEFRSPNAVLFKEDGASGKAFVDDNHLPVISDKGTAKNSRIELTKNHAGLKLPKTEKEDATPALDSIEFLFSKYINEGVTEYSLTNAGGEALNVSMFGENKPDSYVKHGFGKKSGQLASTTSNTVLDFQEFKFSQKSELEDGVGKYSFEILGEKAPVLELPTHSGVLATETYVDSGFVVVKKIIEDLYNEIMNQTTSGRIDWLQTLVPADTPTGKKIYDSRVNQILSRSSDILDKENPYDGSVNSLSFGFYLVKAFDDAHEEVLNNLSLYTKVTVKKELDESDGPIELKIGDITYNPSHLPVGGKVNNVLPNHSGTLLNNNSVIDGGEWL